MLARRRHMSIDEFVHAVYFNSEFLLPKSSLAVGTVRPKFGFDRFGVMDGMGLTVTAFAAGPFLSLTFAAHKPKRQQPERLPGCVPASALEFSQGWRAN
jgi:hypothetical protein